MRPAPPPAARPSLVDRLGFQRLFSPATRIILRNLERRPGRALLSVAGLALATALLMIGRFSDAIDFVMAVEFGQAQRQDATITLFEARSRRAVYEIGRMPGVLHAEPFRAVAARLRHGHLTRRGGIMGVEPGATLARVLDERQRAFSIPADGLVVSEKLAQILNLRVGDPVTIEVLEGARPTRETFLAAVVHDYLGTSAYMDLPALNRLMREGGAVSGANLLVDDRHAPELYAALKNTPAVAGVTITRAARNSFEQTMAETLALMMGFIVTLAGVITFGVVYNTMRVALSERAWELATLRVLGFTQNEVAAMLLGEMAILTAAAIPLGLVTGRWLVSLMMQAYDTELFRIPPVLAPSSYGMAVVVTAVAAVVSSALVWRRIAHLDLVAVLKSRE
jgi:putative ABC transport system permease protein